MHLPFLRPGRDETAPETSYSTSGLVLSLEEFSYGLHQEQLSDIAAGTSIYWSTVNRLLLVLVAQVNIMLSGCIPALNLSRAQSFL